MYAEDRILAREQSSPGRDGTWGAPDRVSVRRPRGILEILSGHESVRKIVVTRVVGDVVLLHVTLVAIRTLLTVTSPTSRPARPHRRRTGPGGRSARSRADRRNGGMTPCSATEPEQVYPTAGPYPAVCRDGGARVRIFQADTGLVESAAQTFPWLDGVTGDDDPRAGTVGQCDPALRGTRDVRRGRPAVYGSGTQVHVETSSPTAAVRWNRTSRRGSMRPSASARDPPHDGFVPYLEEHPAAGPGGLAEAASLV